MSKPKNNDFLANLYMTLLEFHEWQLDNREDGKVPYEYNTIGLAEWLAFDKGIEIEGGE